MVNNSYSRIVGAITLTLLLIFLVIITSVRNFQYFTIELSSEDQFYFLIVISFFTAIWLYQKEHESKDSG